MAWCIGVVVRGTIVSGGADVLIYYVDLVCAFLLEYSKISPEVNKQQDGTRLVER